MRFGVCLPLEKTAEREMLYHRELAEHLGGIHLEHALVDFAPAVFDATDIVKYG